MSLTEGEELKRQGLLFAVTSKPAALAAAIDCARYAAISRGIISIDDVWEWMASARLAYSRASLGNAAGAVFMGKEWEHVGYTKSRHKEGHARTVKTWRLVGHGVGRRDLSENQNGQAEGPGSGHPVQDQGEPRRLA